MARAKVTASATAQNTATEWVLLQGKFNVSVSGMGTATCTLQRKFGASGTALDIETYVNTNTQKQAEEPEDDVYYRLIVKTGDYTSGTIEMRLSQ